MLKHRNIEKEKEERKHGKWTNEIECERESKQKIKNETNIKTSDVI